MLIFKCHISASAFWYSLTPLIRWLALVKFMLITIDNIEETDFGHEPVIL